MNNFLNEDIEVMCCNEGITPEEFLEAYEELNEELNESVKAGKKYLKSLAVDGSRYEGHDADYFYEGGKYYKQMKKDTGGVAIKRAKRKDLKAIGTAGAIADREKALQRKQDAYDEKKKNVNVDLLKEGLEELEE